MTRSDDADVHEQALEKALAVLRADHAAHPEKYLTPEEDTLRKALETLRADQAAHPHKYAVDMEEEPQFEQGESFEEFEARTRRDLSVGAVLREAREEDCLGVRELARRAGVDPSRLSRIESGRTARPDDEVLAKLARALGRSPVPLQALVREIHPEEFESHYGALDDLHPDTEEGHEESRRKQARLMFLNSRPLEELADQMDPVQGAQVAEIVTSWGALTEDRRRLVRAFVADQVALSDLDNRDRHPAPFVLRVSLEVPV